MNFVKRSNDKYIISIVDLREKAVSLVEKEKSKDEVAELLEPQMWIKEQYSSKLDLSARECSINCVKPKRKVIN